MNKDVIYIEPEDDITDIIAKIENSKEKIVALVPPKKAGVFRSIVNIKLIAKAGATAEKAVVLVTTDPSIIKLAAATKIPVTKNLQSAPAVPEVAEEAGVETVSRETVDEDGKSEKPAKTDDDTEVKAEAGASEIAAKEGDDADKNDDSEDDSSKDSVKDKKKLAKEKAKKAGVFSIQWIKAHKPLVIGCGVGLVALILVLIWAFGIAPAATVTVGIRTTKNNFSENVTFTDKLADENVETGKFYLEEKKLETKREVLFEPTGKKNVGEKAKGTVVIYNYFSTKGTVGIDAGAVFKVGDLSFVADQAASLSWDGTVNKNGSSCENDDIMSDGKVQCLISGRVAVTAAEPGTQYNIPATSAGWTTTANVAVYSDAAMTGGTDKTITVVQQSDIDKAKSELATENESANKEKLYDTLEDGAFVIDSSFKQTVGDATSSPAVGEEVKDGEKAKLTVVTTDVVYIIDKTKVEEFITAKAKLAENFKIYAMNDPFIENFTKTDSGYTGKLKTSYTSGPRVTENDVIDIIKGKGLGVAQHDLKDINGISSIRIDTSFPWVTSIPSNPDKITVILDVEE